MLCSWNKKNMKQFIPNLIYNFFYQYYKLQFLDSSFKEESLKNRLQET
jgi:hypothetical protein